tara:strand:+ start:1133 stop:1546 length:414 start_codon:yes stop_codon:yes gene_type:complete
MTESAPLTPAMVITNCACGESGADQTWLFRTLLLLKQAQMENAKLFRATMTDDRTGDRIENRNSSGYWLEWMTEGSIPRNADAETINVIRNLNEPIELKRTLTREHLDNAVALTTHPVVAQAVVNYVNTGEFTTHTP